MVLYHGSLVRVVLPAIVAVPGTKDFGAGFYTTTSEQQAYNFVRRRLRRAHKSTGYINVYDFDEASMVDLDVLRFTAADHEWVEFVRRNRMEVDFSHGHDLVIGPVANDDVYDSFSVFIEGKRSEAQLIAGLLTFRLHDQWLFHTERSLERLRFRQALEVSTNKTSSDE